MPLFFSYRSLPRGRRRRFGASWYATAYLLLCASASIAATSHSKSVAEYARAETLQRRLYARPVAERTRADYERALNAYRSVYHADPGSPDAAPAVASVADLLAEEARCFHDPRLLRDAAAQWKFLRSQYPGSPLLRRRARVQEAEIEHHEPRPQADTKNAPHRFSAESSAGVFDAVQAPRPIEHTSLERTSGAPAKPKAASIMPNTLHATRPSPAPVTEQQDPIAVLQGVRSWTQGNSTRIAIDLSGATPYRVYPSPDYRRIIVIFFGARPAESLLEHVIAFPHDANVRSANVKPLTGNQAEMVLQLLRPLKFSSFILSNPDRLVLDVGGVSEARPLQAVASPSEKVLLRTPPQTAIAARPENTSMRPIAADSASDAQHSLTRVLGLRIRRIVIDAGHGGHDSGTLGPGGLEEKDVALEVALRLGRLLQQQMGADVIYTRRTDKFVPLEQRTALANRAHADLFISIHANSSTDPGARGVETYFLNFTASPTALNVAARENAVSDRSVYELSGLVRRITLTDKIDESRAFAEDVQQSLFSGLAAGNDGLKNRGVKQAPFMVLIGAHMPSILVEISFLTNPLDATQLEQPAYRERLAEALYRGVSEYVDGMSGVRVAKSAPTKMIPAPAE